MSGDLAVSADGKLSLRNGKDSAHKVGVEQRTLRLLRLHRLRSGRRGRKTSLGLLLLRLRSEARLLLLWLRSETRLLLRLRSLLLLYLIELLLLLLLDKAGLRSGLLALNGGNRGSWCGRSRGPRGSSRSLRVNGTERLTAGEGRDFFPRCPLGRMGREDGLRLGGGHAEEVLQLAVPGFAVGPGAGVAAVLGLADISLASGVGEPSAVAGASGVDSGSDGTGEVTFLAEIALGTVTGDAGADSGDLLLYSGFVFDAARDVGPCSVLLNFRKMREKRL